MGVLMGLLIEINVFNVLEKRNFGGIDGEIVLFEDVNEVRF